MHGRPTHAAGWARFFASDGASSETDPRIAPTHSSQSSLLRNRARSWDTLACMPAEHARIRASSDGRHRRRAGFGAFLPCLALSAVIHGGLAAAFSAGGVWVVRAKGGAESGSAGLEIALVLPAPSGFEPRTEKQAQAPVEITVSSEMDLDVELEPLLEQNFSEERILALLQALPETPAGDGSALADPALDVSMPSRPFAASIERRARARARLDAASDAGRGSAGSGAEAASGTGSGPGEFDATDRKASGSSSPPTRQAVPVESPSPRYPSLSVRAGEEGTVLCRIRIASDGSVSEVEIVESSGFPRLDQAAREGLLRWRFAPTIEAGVPVASTLLHPVEFLLTKD